MLSKQKLEVVSNPRLPFEGFPDANRLCNCESRAVWASGELLVQIRVCVSVMSQAY